MKNHIVVIPVEEVEPIEELSLFNIGGAALYVPPYERTKEEPGAIYGKIKDFNNESRICWVVSNCNGDWSNYFHYTGQAVRYEDLVLI